MPDVIPIELARAQCRANSTEDALLQQYIDAATGHVEGRTGLSLTPITVVDTMDRWSRVTALSRWPVTQITGVSYLDMSGLSQSLDVAFWRGAMAKRPARVSFLGRLPALADGSDLVTITYSAGYPTADAAPAPVKQAMLLLIAEYYENREAGAISADVEKAVASLLRDFRRRTL